MDAITLLEKQHREVEKLFEEFKKSSKKEDHERSLALFHEIANHLAIHCTIEEKVFYPSVYIGETEEKLQEAVEEHLSAKRIIADLLDLEPTDDSFEAKMQVLEEQIKHHVEEEEDELFKDVKKNFTKEELIIMASQMQAMAEALEAGEPAADIPSQTDEAAPLQ